MNIRLRPIKMLSAIAALAAFAQAADYSSWARYRPVTLNTSGMGLSAAVTNVPISVRFKASAHKDMLDSVSTQVQLDGSDIRVTKADGTTDVPFEIEHLSTGPDGKLHLWILADNVPADNPAAATYRVYWGKTGETSLSNPAATFPTSAGFQAVFHLNDTGSTIVNSANSALNGTAFGTSTTTGTPAGNGFVSAKSGARVRTFGTSAGGEDNAVTAENYIRINPAAGHVLSTHTGPITMEGWVYSSITNNGNTSPGTKHIIAHGAGNTGGAAWFARTAGLDGGSEQNHYSAGGPNTIEGPVAPWAEQHFWQYVAAVWDGTNWIIYRQRETDFWNIPDVTGPPGMNPDSVKYRVMPGVAPTASTAPWFIGAAADDTVGNTMTRGWHGWMDEVRISTVARDSNYIKLNFLTQRNDSLSGVVHPVNIGETVQPGQGAFGAWSGKRSIVLNTTETGANVAGGVANFPVLVRLGQAEASIIASAKAGGADIRFTKADDVTPLNFEIDHWGPNSAAIWVLVDTILGNNATQSIRMHWGNPAAESVSDGSAVFDSARGYLAVYHLGNAAGSDPRPNASGPGNPATPENFAGGYAPIPGIVGMADSLPGGTRAGGARLNLGTGFSNWQGQMTMSLWIKPYGSTDDWNQYISLSNGTNGTPGRDNIWMGRQGGNTNFTTELYNGTEGGGHTHSNNVQVMGEWQLLSWTVTDGDQVAHYRNGVPLAKRTSDESIKDTTRTVNHIGRAPWPDPTIHGVFDEVRIANVARDSNWMKLEYENQKPVNTLVNIGLPVITAPGQPTGVTAVADTGAAIVSWVAPADNGGSPITEYKATVLGDTTMACTSSDALSCKITGLTPGQPYRFLVRASNVAGRGAYSSASNEVTPVNPAPPSAPQTPTAVVNGTTSITVSWTAPASNGGGAITGYTVTGVPAGTCFTETELTCTVQGLTQGTQYKFTVTASNIGGASPASDTVTATTTGLLPGAFAIRADGNPYTYRIPTANLQATDALTMTIVDVHGKTVWSSTVHPSRTKVDHITWNGRSSTGMRVASGMYIVRIEAKVNGEVIQHEQKGVQLR